MDDVEQAKAAIEDARRHLSDMRKNLQDAQLWMRHAEELHAEKQRELAEILKSKVRASSSTQGSGKRE